MRTPQGDPAPDDAELVGRVKTGDRAAYRELLRRHGPGIHRYAERLVRDPAEAEDVVQETFLRLWLRAKDYDPVARVTTWLFRITHNLAVDRLRKRGRSALTEDLDMEPGPISVNPPALLEGKQRAEALTAALDTLPPRQASALSLVHLHGMTGAEAAAVLEVSEEALESLLSRGRRALKAQLAGSFERDARGTP
jgi:RNA polymerase sigma-70 factor (ECF subfamily)